VLGSLPARPGGAAGGAPGSRLQPPGGRRRRQLRSLQPAAWSPEPGARSLCLYYPDRCSSIGGHARKLGVNAMSATPMTLESVRSALLEAGLEVFRVEGQAVHLAERVRSHLMDAGVRVRPTHQLTVDVTIRAQRSDFPSDTADALFARVRAAVSDSATARGFIESDARPREIRDPVDDSRLLDVWYELTFSKDTARETLVDDVRWAIRLSKCVAR